MEKIEENGLYFKIAGDERWHFDNKKATQLFHEQVPDYWLDTCPNCGNTENISGCRCPTNHRTCPKCGYKWHWILSKIQSKWVRIKSE